MDRVSSINLLYPPFKDKLLAGLQAANDKGIPLRVFETYRSPNRQAALYAQGRTVAGKKITWVKPMESYHQYGIAADLVLWVDGKWDWSQTHLYRLAGAYFEDVGLTWLGRDTSDLVHYQIKLGIDISLLEQIYAEDGLPGVWLYLENKGI